MQTSEWFPHQPAAPDAPIPMKVWYSGCAGPGDSGKIDPNTGICTSCGETACPKCGAGFHVDGKCQCG